MRNQYFNQALSDFVNDVAYGGAVRHLADLGYTVSQIVEALDYPVAMERVGAIVWRHYMEQGIILLEKPEDSPAIRKVSYVKEYGKYGAVHFRQVTEEVGCAKKDYYPCEFGRRRYQDETAFRKGLECLEKGDREYILGLPWPIATAYHIADARMGRIMQKLEGERRG